MSCCVQAAGSLYFLYQALSRVDWFPLDPHSKTEFLVDLLKAVHWLCLLVSHILGMVYRSERLRVVLGRLARLGDPIPSPKRIALSWLFPLSVVATVVLTLILHRFHRLSFGKMYFIMYYVSFIPHVLIDMIFTVSCTWLGEEFRRTNERILRCYKLDGSRLIEEIAKIRRHHLNLSEMITQLDDCFCFDTINSVFYIQARSIVYVHIIMTDLFRGDNHWALVGFQFLFQAILLPARLIYLLYCAHSLSVEVR